MLVVRGGRMFGVQGVVGMNGVFVRVLLVEPLMMAVLIVSLGVGRSFGGNGGSLNRCIVMGRRCRRFARGVIMVVIVMMAIVLAMLAMIVVVRMIVRVIMSFMAVRIVFVRITVVMARLGMLIAVAGVTFAGMEAFVLAFRMFVRMLL